VIRRFASSDKFRVNAQRQKIDVWLIYKCLDCDDTWNCPIISRRTPKEIGAARYLKFEQNDRHLAWSCAFDFSLLSTVRVQIDPSINFKVERSGGDASENGQCTRGIRLELTHEGVIRLDRLLAEQLQVSRSCLQLWLATGQLVIMPERKNPLSKPAHNGQIIILSAPTEG